MRRAKTGRVIQLGASRLSARSAWHSAAVASVTVLCGGPSSAHVTSYWAHLAGTGTRQTLATRYAHGYSPDVEIILLFGLECPM